MKSQLGENRLSYIKMLNVNLKVIMYVRKTFDKKVSKYWKSMSSGTKEKTGTLRAMLTHTKSSKRT